MSNKPSGLLAKLRAFAGNVAAIRQLSEVPEEIYRQIDTTITTIGRRGLTLVADLIDYNVTTSFPNWFAKLEWGYNRMGKDFGHAHRVMHIPVRSERSAPEQDRILMPTPLTHEYFSFPAREIAASEEGGGAYSLNTRSVTQGLKNVADAIEDQAWYGGGMTGIYGVFTTPGLNTVDLTGGLAWSNPSHTAAHKVADALKMVDASAAAGFEDAQMILYVPQSAALSLGEDYVFNGQSTKTVLQRLQEIPLSGGKTLIVKVATAIADQDNIALVPMDNDAITLLDGQRPVVVGRERASPYLDLEFDIIAAQWIVPIIDANGMSGITIGAP